jgi:hypothetical protein
MLSDPDILNRLARIHAGARLGPRYDREALGNDLSLR